MSTKDEVRLLLFALGFPFVDPNASCRFMSDIEKYNERLNEIEQLRELKRRELAERAARRDLEIAEKQIFVEQKRRK